MESKGKGHPMSFIKSRNPNAVPTGTKFGFLNYSGDEWSHMSCTVVSNGLPGLWKNCLSNPSGRCSIVLHQLIESFVKLVQDKKTNNQMIGY